MGNNDNLNFYTDFIRGYREPQYKALSCSIWPGMNWSQTGHWAVAEGQHQTQWGKPRSNTAQGRPNRAWGTSWDQARTAACRGLVGPWLGPSAGSWGSAWLRPHCDRGWLPPGPELGSWACPGSIGQPRQTLVRALEGDSSHCTHRSVSFPKGRFSDGPMVCFQEAYQMLFLSDSYWAFKDFSWKKRTWASPDMRSSGVTRSACLREPFFWAIFSWLCLPAWHCIACTAPSNRAVSISFN